MGAVVVPEHNDLLVLAARAAAHGSENHHALVRGRLLLRQKQKDGRLVEEAAHEVALADGVHNLEDPVLRRREVVWEEPHRVPG